MRTLPLAGAPAALTARSAFSYECNRCNRCCTGKRIRVNPYEVFRLARNRGVSTTEFIAQFTAHGLELAQREDGGCVFLGDEGCTVHADRPLVCRLYPLARTVTAGEADGFFVLEGHPLTESVLGADGEVHEYLERQGAAPFMHAADEYLGATLRLTATLTQLGAPDDAPAAGDTDWLDIDAVLAKEAVPTPARAEDAMTHHIAALDAWRCTFTSDSGGQL